MDSFEQVYVFPDPDAQERYGRIIGVDHVKVRLEKEAETILRPDLLEEWASKLHKTKLAALDYFSRRPPLFIFAGDVGTGKTELATTFGDRVARNTKCEVQMLGLSLKARGSGVVGDMTALLTSAFQHVKEHSPKRSSRGAKQKGAMILVIDEADALAQSRELAHMHHEDRAGVNALIRGIDSLATPGLSVLVVMCTNRLESLDPAVRRRAAAVFEFTRPNFESCKSLLQNSLEGVDLKISELDELASRLSKGEQYGYGHTFSDITQRFIPSLVLAAYPSDPITFELALEVLDSVRPTPPFKTQGE